MCLLFKMGLLEYVFFLTEYNAVLTMALPRVWINGTPKNKSKKKMLTGENF